MGISAIYPDTTVQSISWDAIKRITVETNNTGPWGWDVWWLIEGDNASCIYPAGATGDIDALKAMEARFPTFDDKVVIRAMGCTSNARFICWSNNDAL